MYAVSREMCCLSSEVDVVLYNSSNMYVCTYLHSTGTTIKQASPVYDKSKLYSHIVTSNIRCTRADAHTGQYAIKENESISYIYRLLVLQD